MNSFKSYLFSLHSYLSLIDNHYVEGRYLWISNAYLGASNLLWLSFEQLIKFLIVETQILNNVFEEVVCKDDSGAKSRVVIDENERDVKLRFKVLDTLFFKIESKHNIRNLSIKLKEETGIEFSKFEDMLIKVNKGFKRRYVINESFSINPVTLDEIDECFFFLRSFVSDKVPPSFIDELIFKKKYSIQEPVPFFDSLFLKNRHIHSRKYLDLIDKIPDGRVIAHNGLKFKEFPSGSYEYLIRKGYLIQNRFTYLKMKS